MTKVVNLDAKRHARGMRSCEGINAPLDLGRPSSRSRADNTHPKQKRRPEENRPRPAAPGITMERSMTMKVENYFGGCPHCGRTDGYANAGKSHRFFCKDHRTSWCVGSNLFSSWRDQTEDEQRRIWAEIGLDEFTDVEPLPCTEAMEQHPEDRVIAHVGHIDPSDSQSDWGPIPF
jgi:hypothetical protein